MRSVASAIRTTGIVSRLAPGLAIGATALSLLGGCASGHGKYTSEALDKAQLRMGVMKANAEHDMAMQAFLAGDLDKALKTVEHALAMNPESAPCYRLRGRILIEQGAIGEAIFSLRESLRIAPDVAESHYTLGIAYERVRKPGSALEEYQVAMGLKPDDPQHTIACAEVLIDLGRVEEARQMLGASLTSEHSAGIKQLLGHIALLESRPADAVRELREASLLATNDPAILEDLSMALLRSGKYADAERELAQLLRMPSHADRRDLMQLRARCLLSTSRAGEARTVLRKLVASESGKADTTSWIALGEAAFKIGDNRELKQAASRVVSLDPERAEGYILWALWHQMNKDPQQALATIETGIERSAPSTDLNDLRVLLLAQVGRADDAQAALASSDDPEAMIARLTGLTKTLARNIRQ